MDHLYKKIKAEILEDHKRNNYMQSYLMPLRDKDDLENYQRYKQVAQELSDDEGFPYEVEVFEYSNVVKMGYVPLDIKKGDNKE